VHSEGEIFYGYIIYSPSLDKYYVGYSFDLNTRLRQHNSGISTFTSKANDWVLKFSTMFPSRIAAREWESMIKKKKSRKYIEFIISSAG
jgi:putative endonuclease